jgi:hypothetical protein
MVTRPPEIMLRVESGAFNSLVNRKVRKPFETFHPFAVFRGVLGRISGLQEKRQAGRESPLFDPVEDDVLAIRRSLIRQQPRPGRVVEEQQPTRGSWLQARCT